MPIACGHVLFHGKRRIEITHVDYIIWIMPAMLNQYIEQWSRSRHPRMKTHCCVESNSYKWHDCIVEDARRAVFRGTINTGVYIETHAKHSITNNLL